MSPVDLLGSAGGPDLIGGGARCGDLADPATSSTSATSGAGGVRSRAAMNVSGGTRRRRAPRRPSRVRTREGRQRGPAAEPPASTPCDARARQARHEQGPGHGGSQQHESKATVQPGGQVSLAVRGRHLLGLELQGSPRRPASTGAKANKRTTLTSRIGAVRQTQPVMMRRAQGLRLASLASATRRSASVASPGEPHEDGSHVGEQVGHADEVARRRSSRRAGRRAGTGGAVSSAGRAAQQQQRLRSRSAR